MVSFQARVSRRGFRPLLVLARWTLLFVCLLPVLIVGVNAAWFLLGRPGENPIAYLLRKDWPIIGLTFVTLVGNLVWQKATERR